MHKYLFFWGGYITEGGKMFYRSGYLCSEDGVICSMS